MAGKATVGYIISVYDKFTRPLESFNRKLTKLDKNLFKSSSKMSGLSVASGAYRKATILGVSALLALGASLALTNDKFTRLKLGLEVTTGSMSKANKMFEQMRKLSEETPTSLDALVNTAIAMQNLGLSAKETTEEVKRLNLIHIRSTESLDRITNAIIKMRMAGKVTLYTFRGLGQAALPMMKALEKVMEKGGYSVDQTKRLLNQGRISLYALTQTEKEYATESGIAAKVSKQYAETLGGSFTRLMNILSSYSAISYKAVMGTKTIGKEINKLDDFLKNAEKSYTKFINAFAKSPLTKFAEDLNPFMNILKGFPALMALPKLLLPTSHETQIKGKHEITVNVNTQAGTTANVETKSGSPTVNFKVGKNMSHILGRK